MSQNTRQLATNEPTESTIEPGESTNEPKGQRTNPRASKRLKWKIFPLSVGLFGQRRQTQTAILPKEPEAGLQGGPK